MSRSLPSYLVLAALTLFLSGCWGQLVKPMDLTPLTTYAQIPAPDGGRLGLTHDGTLLHYPPLDDLESGLGVSLGSAGNGVRVVDRLIAETELLADDRIVRALPLKPDEDPGSEHLLARVREQGHPVEALADLAGYTRTVTPLVLLVERGGEELALQFTLGAPRVLAQQLWRPDLTRPSGFSGCRLDTAFPAHAAELGNSVLVTWVAKGGKAAQQGIRPLSILRQRTFDEEFVAEEGATASDMTLDDDTLHTPPTASYQAGRRFRAHEADTGYLGRHSLSPPAELLGFDILGGGLGLLSYQSNHVDHAIVTLGPLGYALTYYDKAIFDPDHNDYLEVTTWETQYVFSTSGHKHGRRGEGRTIEVLAKVDDWVTLDNSGDDSRFYFFPEGE